jgi:hypothetical protein
MNESLEKTTMKTRKFGRRDFLKLSGLLAGAVLILETQKYVNLEPQAEFQEALFRGARDGRILVSRDAGKTWETAMDFGSHCRLVSLVSSKNSLSAEVEVAGYWFTVQTADGKKWMTA